MRFTSTEANGPFLERRRAAVSTWSGYCDEVQEAWSFIEQNRELSGWKLLSVDLFLVVSGLRHDDSGQSVFKNLLFSLYLLPYVVRRLLLLPACRCFGY